MKPLLFGKYCLLERISVGGMAEVFRAKPFDAPDFNGYLALKRILPHLAEDEEFIKMFVDEAKVTVQLDHPNIVRTYELGQFQSSFYILMEFVSGRDILALQKTMRRRKEIMPIGMSLIVARDIARGLHYAHHARDAEGAPLNIIHRDVSPQNVLIDYRGNVKVIDFGIAKAAVQSTRTQVGVLKGKMGYMSPEQVQGETIDFRSDVFAIGTVLWEMLTNRRLFHAENEFQTMRMVKEADVPPPSSRNAEVPPEVDALVMRALTLHREDRYPTAGAFADAIDEVLPSFAFDRDDVSVWMRRIFAKELEEERAKRERFASVQTPEDVRRLVEEAYGARGERAADATPAADGTDPDLKSEHSAPYRGTGEGLNDGGAVAAPKTKIWDAEILPAEDEDPAQFAHQHTVVQAGGFDAALAAQKTDFADAPSFDSLAPPVPEDELEADFDMDPTPLDPAPPVMRTDNPALATMMAFTDEPTNPEIPAHVREPIPRLVKIVGILCLLLFFGGAASLAALVFADDEPAPVADAGTLVINVSPPTALEIFVDDELVSTASPVTIDPAGVGRHVVEIRRTNSQTYRAEVEVTAGAVAPLHVELQPIANPEGVVVLRLPDERDDIEIWVDGEKQATPDTSDAEFRVSAGRHLFEALRPGFQPWIATIEVDDAVRKEETVRFQPRRFDLTIEVDPAASVRFDGKNVGRGTTIIEDVDPFETHDLVVTARDRGTSRWRGTLGLPEIASGRFVVDFDEPLPPTRKERDFGRLQVSTGDDWWEIVIDGIPTGVVTPVDRRSALPVWSGRHTLTLRRGTKSHDFDIELQPRETVIISEPLEFDWEG